MTAGSIPELVVRVGRQLRRRNVALGIDDYEALRQSLTAGFGWSSDDQLRELCVALWAKSREDAAIIRATFTRCGLRGNASWSLVGLDLTSPGDQSMEQAIGGEGAPSELYEESPEARAVTNLTDAPPSTGVTGDSGLVLVPQYPLTERDIAQAWRRLRRARRSGPKVEIDMAATVEHHSRHGVATAPVLVPRRRNTAKLLLLIDRFGSMTPFHDYVDYIVHAVRSAGRLDDVSEFYFHDLPGSATNRVVLERLDDPFDPSLDSILSQIRPMEKGYLYNDPKLAECRPLATILDETSNETSIVVISDAGSARGRFDAERLLDTISFLKRLHVDGRAVAWLNPVRSDGWAWTTAGQLSRYFPMYPLTREGIDRAIETLRGRPEHLERSL